MNKDYELLKKLLQFGHAETSSTFRPHDSNGYHRTDQAIDFVPRARLINVIIFYLFWPGGMGVDLKEGNFHIHIDEGPYRRWIE